MVARVFDYVVKSTGKLSLVFLLCAQGCIGTSREQAAAQTPPASTTSSIDIKALANKRDVVPLVVIGSGVAGLGAAIHAARSRIKTIVIRGDEPGGLLTKTTYVENWPGSKPVLGRDLIDQLTDQAQELGGALIKFADDTVESIDTSAWPFTLQLVGGEMIKAMTIIIATGATPKTLNVPGEKEYWGRGVTTCAICDAPFYKEKDVVIVGGGDSAVEEALQLLQYARQVTILVRKEAMRAGASSQERLRSIPAIRVRYGVAIERIEGDGERVTGIQIRKLQENTLEHLPIDGVFLAIGHSPNSQLFAKALDVDDQGYIRLQGRTQATSLPGVFAAGEVDDYRYRQADVEVAEGKKAAMDAIAFLYDSGFSDEPTSSDKPASSDEISSGEDALALKSSRGFGSTTIATTLEEVKDLASKSLLTALYFCDPSSPESVERMDGVVTLIHQVDSHIPAAKVVVSQSPELAKAFFVSQDKMPCLVMVDGRAKLAGRYAGPMTEIDVLTFVKQLTQGA